MYYNIRPFESRSSVSGLDPKIDSEAWRKGAYLTSCKADEISAGVDKSIRSVAGGLARLKPVPTT